MKRQGELEGFERQGSPRIDEAVAAVLEIKERMKAIKAELDAAQERVDFEMAEAELGMYRYIDGDLVIDVSRVDAVKTSYKVVQRPKRQPQGDED